MSFAYSDTALSIALQLFIPRKDCKFWSFYVLVLCPGHRREPAMEAVGAEASTATILQLTGSCLKIGRKVLSPSKHISKDLDRISSVRYSLNGSVKNLQTYR